MKHVKILPLASLVLAFNIICFALQAQNTFPSSGNVGIGVLSPSAKMDLYMAASASPQYGVLLHTGSFYTGANAANSYFLKMIDDGGPATKFIVQGDGSVGINTMPSTGYALSVNGSAIFTRAVVKLYSNWPDYVFKKNYPLTSLNHLADYIQKNEHLPGLPSASEMQQNGQVDLGQINVKLLEKIEELTLYMIELKKENNNVKHRLKALEQATRGK